MSSTLTVGNLAMIFKLDVNQGIYICCEEGEIIIPTETGFFQRRRLLRERIRKMRQKSQSRANISFRAIF